MDTPLVAGKAAKGWSTTLLGFPVSVWAAGSLVVIVCVATTLGIVLAPRASSAAAPVASQIQVHYFNGTTTLMEVDFASTSLSSVVGVQFGVADNALFYSAPATVGQYSASGGYVSPFLYHAVLNLSSLPAPLSPRVFYRVASLDASGVAWSGTFSFAPHPGVGTPGVTCVNARLRCRPVAARSRPASSSLPPPGSLCSATSARRTTASRRCSTCLTRPSRPSPPSSTSATSPTRTGSSRCGTSMRTSSRRTAQTCRG